MIRKRQLNQNAVHLIVLVQNANKIQQLLLRGIFIEPILKGVKTYLFTSLLLVADIDLRSRIVSHQNHCQTRLNAVIVPQLLCFFLNFCTNRSRNFFSRNQFSHSLLLLFLFFFFFCMCLGRIFFRGFCIICFAFCLICICFAVCIVIV